MNPYQPGEDNQDHYEVGYKAGKKEAADRIEELDRERDALQADAARYQWLRKRLGVDKDVSIKAGAYIWMPGGSTRIDAEIMVDTDKAIDFAIEKEQQQ